MQKNFNKTEIIKFRCTETEKTKIMQNADRENKKMTAYITDCIKYYEKNKSILEKRKKEDAANKARILYVLQRTIDYLEQYKYSVPDELQKGVLRLWEYLN